MKYEPIIGLEIHLQLNTNSKAFCACPNQFGGLPNHYTCPICLGHPGTLPLLNEKIIEKAIIVGLSLESEIQSFSRFDRKHYFYPDLPKGYQISQFYLPICKGGYIEIEPNKKIALNRIHIEEDAGKLIHKETKTYVDLNRAGVPLLEIVTEPCIKSSKDAYNFLKELKSILSYLKVSDCNMEEGSLRCDANISIMKDNLFGPKVEIKNLNSFKNIQKAIDFEIERQKDLLNKNIPIIQETRLYDADQNKTYSMRMKEESIDYKYFPDPDIAPIILEKEEILKYKQLIPELRKEKKIRYKKDYLLPELDTDILTSDIDIAKYFEEVLKEYPKNAKKIASWVKGHVLSFLNENKIEIKDFPISPKDLAILLKNLDEETIHIKLAKDIYNEMLNGGSVIDLIKKFKSNSLEKDDLIKIIHRILKDKHNESAIQNYKNGKSQALGFLTGQIMKETKGNANPADINLILTQELDKI